jgi:hypothetical protein
MGSTAVVAGESKRDLITHGWIINKKDDLIWFIGSVVFSYLFLGASLTFIKYGIPVMIVVWVWALGFDGPHVFATVSRTYADREERRKRARLLYGTLLLFLVGPTMVLAGRAQLLGTAVWAPLFFFLASVWAYYHLVKQHYGFMVLYKKKNNDLAEIDNLIDRAFLLLGMAYPFLHFVNNSVAASGRVPLTSNAQPVWWLETLTLWGFAIAAVLFGARQVQRLYLRLPINGPKMLLLAAALPMHWIVLRVLEPVQPASAAALSAVATLTIFHNIQYHRIVWFHNQNKYGRKGSLDYGAASRISKTVWHYVGFAVLFGAAYHIPHYTMVAPDSLAMAFIWGGAFTHYYLDSKIWRVRRDKKLNENLQMSEPAEVSAA